MINMLRTLMERVDNKQEQKGNRSRGGNPKTKSKEILEIKNTNGYFKNKNDDCLLPLILSLVDNMAKERICEH